MDNLILSFTVIFPMFLQLILGYFLKHIGLTDEHSLQICNKLVFRVFLPAVLFLNIYNADLQHDFDVFFFCAAVSRFWCASAF